MDTFLVFILSPGGAGVKNFSVGICDGAPSTWHSSFCFGGICYENTSVGEGRSGLCNNN